MQKLTDKKIGKSTYIKVKCFTITIVIQLSLDIVNNHKLYPNLITI